MAGTALAELNETKGRHLGTPLLRGMGAGYFELRCSTTRERMAIGPRVDLLSGPSAGMCHPGVRTVPVSVHGRLRFQEHSIQMDPNEPSQQDCIAQDTATDSFPFRRVRRREGRGTPVQARLTQLELAETIGTTEEAPDTLPSPVVAASWTLPRCDRGPSQARERPVALLTHVAQSTPLEDRPIGLMA